MIACRKSPRADAITSSTRSAVRTPEANEEEEEEVERNTDQTAPTEVIVKKVAQLVTKVANINQLKSKLKHHLSKLNQKDNSYHHRVEFICHHSK